MPDEAAACEAVLDYGDAIKDLAAANIFTGDMLLKNFGVTRHGRVICYDYDELCLLSDCNFRRLPRPRRSRRSSPPSPGFTWGSRTSSRRSSAPSWFRRVGCARPSSRPTASCRRGVLARVQRRLEAGEVFDVFPYRRSVRLRRDPDS